MLSQIWAKPAVLSSILFEPRLTAAAAGLIGALIGLTGTLLVTIVNGLFARDRHRHEKVWERRQEACSEIIGALRAAKPLAERIYEGFDEDPHGYYASDGLKAHHEAYWGEIRKADEAFKANYLILPTQFRDRYERLLTARRAWDYDAGPDIYLGPMREVVAATRDLMDLALSSLGIVPWSYRVGISLRLTGGKLGRAIVKAAKMLRRPWKRLSRRRAQDSLDM